MQGKALCSLESHEGVTDQDLGCGHRGAGFLHLGGGACASCAPCVHSSKLNASVTRAPVRHSLPSVPKGAGTPSGSQPVHAPCERVPLPPAAGGARSYFLRHLGIRSDEVWDTLVPRQRWEAGARPELRVALGAGSGSGRASQGQHEFETPGAWRTSREQQVGLSPRDERPLQPETAQLTARRGRRGLCFGVRGTPRQGGRARADPAAAAHRGRGRGAERAEGPPGSRALRGGVSATPRGLADRSGVCSTPCLAPSPQAVGRGHRGEVAGDEACRTAAGAGHQQHGGWRLCPSVHSCSSSRGARSLPSLAQDSGG